MLVHQCLRGNEEGNVDTVNAKWRPQRAVAQRACPRCHRRRLRASVEHESHLQPRICSRVSKYYLCEGPSNQQAYFSPRKRFLAITKPLLLEQGGRSGGGQQAPALQGEPAEEEGEEGEETAEERGGVQPPRPHLLHARQQPLADGPLLEP